MGTELAIKWDTGKYEFHRKLGNFVHYFQVNLPTNSFGIPLQVIDPLLLVEAVPMSDVQTTDDVPDELVDRCIINVDIDDNLPVIDGTPIWERWDGESLEYYKLFKEYREMLYIQGTRAIARLAEQFNIAGKYLNALAKVYHWKLRVQAYDWFKKLEYERKRQLEIRLLESRHAEAAAKMLEQGMSYLEDHPEQLNPKLAMQMVQMAVRVGRLAVGLNPDKAGDADSRTNTQININQNLGTGSTDMSAGSVQEVGHKKNVTDEDLSNLESILHILDKSGALDRSKSQVVDADYTVVDGGDEATA